MHLYRQLKLPSAILYDWDNTLADSLPAVHKAMDAMCEMHQIAPHDRAAMREHWVRSPDTFYDTYFPAIAKGEGAAEFFRTLERFHLETAALLPGAEDSLKLARDYAILNGVVSNKTKTPLMREIEHLNVAHHFDVIVPRHAEPKPSPAPLVVATQKLGIPFSDIWYVGDEPVDSHAARSDAVQRIIIGKHLKDTIDRHDYGADPVGRIIYLDSLTELPALIQQAKSNGPRLGNGHGGRWA